MGVELHGTDRPLIEGRIRIALTFLVAISTAPSLVGVAPLQAQVPLSASAPYVEITFLDVGPGDAVVVRSPGGATMMVDAGPESPLRPIARLGVDSLSLVVATHPHPDHIGGMEAILTARPVARYFDGGMAPETAVHERLLATLQRISSVLRTPAADTTLRVGDLTVDVLEPDDAGGSVGLVVHFGDFAALLTGDAGRDQLTRWLQAGRVPDVTVLKASDHGSVAGFTHAFVDAANPDVVVISVGESNERGDPRAEALTAYRQHADRVLRTDVEGHVTIRGFADGSYEVLTGEDIDDRRPWLEANVAAGSLGVVPDSSGVAPDSSGVAAASSELASAAADPGSPLSIHVVVDEPGTRLGDLNGDYVIVGNGGDTAIDLSWWRLCDLSTRCFRFPPGTSVPPGREVAVYTGFGYPDGVSFFMNNDRRVWNENGDEAVLYDDAGRLVQRHVY